MKNEATAEKTTEVFVDLNNGEYLQFDMTLPIQMLFDDVMNFVSKTDFEWLWKKFLTKKEPVKIITGSFLL